MPGGADQQEYVLRKLPQVTVLFWILKTVAVTLGETAGDLMGITFRVGYVAAGVVFAGFLAAAAAGQLRARRFHPAPYWSVVLGTSMVGTEISDFLNRGFGHGSAPDGVGYGWGAVLLTTVLAVVFLLWWRTGHTYDVENISSHSGEVPVLDRDPGLEHAGDVQRGLARRRHRAGLSRGLPGDRRNPAADPRRALPDRRQQHDPVRHNPVGEAGRLRSHRVAIPLPIRHDGKGHAAGGQQ